MVRAAASVLSCTALAAFFFVYACSYDWTTIPKVQPEAGASCTQRSNCGEGEYCAAPEGRVCGKQPGTCRPSPRLADCLNEPEEPVCLCEFIEQAPPRNACAARALGTDVRRCAPGERDVPCGNGTCLLPDEICVAALGDGGAFCVQNFDECIEDLSCACLLKGNLCSKLDGGTATCTADDAGPTGIQCVP